MERERVVERDRERWREIKRGRDYTFEAVPRVIFVCLFVCFCFKSRNYCKVIQEYCFLTI